MTRADAVRYLRTEATMAFPHGRLSAIRSGHGYVLASDGWIHVGRTAPAGAVAISRQEAEAWCEREGWDAALLDRVPVLA